MKLFCGGVIIFLESGLKGESEDDGLGVLNIVHLND